MSKENNLTDFLTDIANTIRAKKGTTGLINPQDFSTEIANLSVNEKFNALVDRTIKEITAKDLQGVTSIGENTFRGCKDLTKVIISDSVTSIGESAFYDCWYLTRVEIGNNVTDIGPYAFYHCSSLFNILIPSKVTDIGSYALAIGSSANKATIHMLSTTPPQIQSNTFDTSRLERIIVPAGTSNTYKTTGNWTSFADYIFEQ